MQLKFIAGLLSAAVVFGCGGQDDYQPVTIFKKPQALEEHLVWIDTFRDRALVLDVGAKVPKSEVSTYALPPVPVIVERRLGHNELLLLTKGHRDGEALLSVLGPKKVEREYPVKTRFDHITQSEDGRYAFVWFQPGGVRSEDESILFNPNEVAIVDLDANGEEAITSRSLRGFGSTPTKVVFSPPMTVNGQKRRFALVLYDSHLSLLDLEHLDRPEFTVELSSNQSIGLNLVRFSASENKIYLLGERSSDVFVLTLLPAGDNRVNDFEPSLNQLGASTRPTDMALYKSDGQNRLLAVSGSQALIIEAGSNRITPIQLEHQATNILLFEGTAPFDDEVEQRALLYSQNSPLLTFLDLDQAEERTTRNLEVLKLSGNVGRLIPLDDNLVLVTRTTGLSMLSLEGRAASELSSSRNVGEAIASLEFNRLWVAPSGTRTLAYVDFTEDSSTSSAVRVDESVRELLLFTGAERPKVVLTHDSAGGAVTIIDAKNPRDGDKAVSLRGFFYPDLFDR